MHAPTRTHALVLLALAASSALACPPAAQPTAQPTSSGSSAPTPSSATSALPTAGPASTGTPRAGPAVALAEPTGDDATRESVPTSDGDLVHGRSTVLVHAPLAKVRRVVLRFDDYAEFMPHYTASRVLGKKPDGAREVFMQVAALNGVVKMGARIVFPSKPADEGGYETYESRFLGGNVEDFKAIWRMKPVDAERTLLSLEVFLLPGLPLPTSVINDENLGGAVKGVKAMRARIEAAP